MNNSGILSHINCQVHNRIMDIINETFPWFDNHNNELKEKIEKMKEDIRLEIEDIFEEHP